MIGDYVSRVYMVETFREKHEDSTNLFHILFMNDQAASYSKEVLNTDGPGNRGLLALKLDRLYFLPENLGSGLGANLLQYLQLLAR